MTFNMNRAWDEAVRTLKANKELVLVLAGLFFFLPVFALGIFVPETLTGPTIVNTASPGPEIVAYYNRNSGWLLLLQIIQFLGMLSILALFARRRPTVGQAIAAGGIALLPLLVAAFFLSLTIGLLGGVVMGLAAAASSGLALLIGLVVLLVALLVLARLTPLPPLLVTERRLNPFAAMVDSWRMTTGKGWRIFGFLALLVVAYTVVAMLVRGVSGLLGALVTNAQAANLMVGAITGIMSAAWLSLLMAVLMAIYRQLTASQSAAGVPRTHSDS